MHVHTCIIIPTCVGQRTNTTAGVGPASHKCAPAKFQFNGCLVNLPLILVHNSPLLLCRWFKAQLPIPGRSAAPALCSHCHLVFAPGPGRILFVLLDILGSVDLEHL